MNDYCKSLTLPCSKIQGKPLEFWKNKIIMELGKYAGNIFDDISEQELLQNDSLKIYLLSVIEMGGIDSCCLCREYMDIDIFNFRLWASGRNNKFLDISDQSINNGIIKDNNYEYLFMKISCGLITEDYLMVAVKNNMKGMVLIISKFIQISINILIEALNYYINKHDLDGIKIILSTKKIDITFNSLMLCL